VRACSKHSSFTQSEREIERKREGERERKRERERERKKEREREMYNMVAVFLFLIGMMGALAPFSYLVNK
jgi:hypothetical protein